MGRVCYHPCETACNRGQLDEAVGINSVEGFLGDEAIKQGWTVEPGAEPSGKRVLVVGAGPSGPVRRLPPHPPRPQSRHQRGRPDGRRHDALRHPQVPACRATCSTPRCSGPRQRKSSLPIRKVTNIEEAMDEGGFDAAFLAVGARTSPSGPTSRRENLPTSSTPSRCCGAWRRASSRCWAAAWSSTAAATPPWTWPALPRPRRLGRDRGLHRRNRERMPAHDFEVEEAEEEGVMMRWLSTIKEADEGKLTIEKMELDESGFQYNRRASSRSLRGRLGRAGPRAGHRPVAARRRIRSR